jgi:protein-S-isoprenylcysteine O-methyltransferase Ste14
MYLALQAIIAGQVLLPDRLVLLLYAAGILAMTIAFVRFFEEPALARRYGEQCEAYRRAVPGWLPRWPRKRGDFGTPPA